MKEIKINELAYIIKQAREHNQPKPIFFLGAGASESGNIPLAKKIVKDIVEKYPENPFILKLTEEEKTYPKLMECLSPHERNELLKKYIDEAKINVTHIYLAQLLKNDFADYVLTVNFDNLMLRALALYNIFPPTYDMAILKDLTTTTFPEKSVVYLHGQHHGLWLLNTEDEMEKVGETVPRIFDSIKHKRPWIFIGYSGSDPIFKHIQNLGRFDNGLYWIGYNNSKPNDEVQKFLTTSNKNAALVKGYDADAFMLKLNEELGLPQPQILSKPFSSLKDMLEEINDINDEDHFKGVKERLEIAKEKVFKAIEQFEEGKIDTATSKRELQIDRLKQEIIQLSISEDFDEARISTIEEQVKELNDESLNESLASLYFNWGCSIGEMADKESGIKKERLLNLAIEKYQKATKMDKKSLGSFGNWGNNLSNLAEMKKGKEKEKLLQLSIKKYQKVIEINDQDDKVYVNWGNSLNDLSNIKKGLEKEKFLIQSIEKYQKAIEINDKDYKAFGNWAFSLIDLAAEIKKGKEKEELLNLAIKKYQKALEINPNDLDYYDHICFCLVELSKIKKGKEREELLKEALKNAKKTIHLGGSHYNMACLYALQKNKTEALKYLELSLKRKDVTVDFVLKDKDWQHYQEDKDFKAIIEKYS